MIFPALRTAKLTIVLCLVGFTLAGCPGPADTPGPTIADLVVLSREHLDHYVAGEAMVITVEIETAEDVEISAIALVETCPPGWVYISAENSSGMLPAIRPEAGSEGMLSFVWIQPPSFPYTFTYTLGIPQDAEGTVTLDGRVEYRVGDGEAEFTETLRSVIAES